MSPTTSQKKKAQDSIEKKRLADQMHQQKVRQDTIRAQDELAKLFMEALEKEKGTRLYRLVEKNSYLRDICNQYQSLVEKIVIWSRECLDIDANIDTSDLTLSNPVDKDPSPAALSPQRKPRLPTICRERQHASSLNISLVLKTGTQTSFYFQVALIMKGQKSSERKTYSVHGLLESLMTLDVSRRYIFGHEFMLNHFEVGKGAVEVDH